MLLLLIVVGVIFVFGFVVFFGAPYVPSTTKEVANAFDTLYPLGPKDTLIDIGSGDGKVLRMAAERGARAIGYELNPALVIISNFLSRHDKRVRTRLVNAWNTDLPQETTVIYIFMVERDAAKFSRIVQQQAEKLGKQIYVISYGSQLTMKPYKKHRAHFLYKIKPLQPEKPQV